jgi:hypothetical protein
MKDEEPHFPIGISRFQSQEPDQNGKSDFEKSLDFLC